MTFREKWSESVARKSSVLCAGIDPADPAMGRQDSLPLNERKRIWSLDFIESVAPYAAAIKPNSQYYIGLSNDEREFEDDEDDPETLTQMADMANEFGLVSILDAKIADIGSTSEAGIWSAADKGFDAVTVAPYAGNMAQLAAYGRKHGIGIITMCLMSNPEYAFEKLALMRVRNPDTYRPADLIEVPGRGPHVHRYLQLAHDAHHFGIDGIVIGAPSPDNHITEEEIANARFYAGDEMLVLMPGVGAQGGEAKDIWRHFDPASAIVNVGRGLMFPKEGGWSLAAESYRDMLNGLRQRP